MEPALRKRMWRCQVWMRFLNTRRVAALPENLNKPFGFIELGHTVVITAVGHPASRFPPTFVYELDGTRLTPAVFGDEVNRILDLHAQGVLTLPYRKEP